MVRCHVCDEENHDHVICDECQKYPILNSEGDEMQFYNKGVLGGFIAKNKRTGEISEDHICYINGVKCWADEYRFGGIIIVGFKHKDS